MIWAFKEPSCPSPALPIFGMKRRRLPLLLYHFLCKNPNPSFPPPINTSRIRLFLLSCSHSKSASLCFSLCILVHPSLFFFFFFYFCCMFLLVTERKKEKSKVSFLIGTIYGSSHIVLIQPCETEFASITRLNFILISPLISQALFNTGTSVFVFFLFFRKEFVSNLAKSIGKRTLSRNRRDFWRMFWGNFFVCDINESPNFARLKMVVYSLFSLLLE